MQKKAQRLSLRRWLVLWDKSVLQTQNIVDEETADTAIN
jgi:hypothetical protein